MAINIGIIGTGGMGARHASNLHRHVKGAQVGGVYDVDKARAKHIAAQCGDAHVYAKAETLIADETIAAVVIASPDATHAALARSCLQHDKPVLCEKPLATTVADAQAVVDAEVAAGRRLLSLGFMRRFDPNHVGVKCAIEGGALGRPVLFKGSSREPSIPPGVSDAERLSNSVCHDIDAMRWLTGQEPRSVFAQGVATRAYIGSGHHDLLIIQVALDDAMLAMLESFPNAGYGYDIQAEVVCENGVATTAYPDAAHIRMNQRRGSHVPADWLERFQPAYVAEFQAWVDSLNGGPPFPGASAWDGYCAARLAEACTQSLKSGAPVSIAVAEQPAIYA